MKKLFYLIIIIGSTACNSTPASGVLGPEEFEKLISDSNVQLVDVRTPMEFQQGYIENALLIDFYEEDFKSRVNNLDKNRPIAVYCAVGQRSYSAYEYLLENGFKSVHHLDGGINAWIAARKPIQK